MNYLKKLQIIIPTHNRENILISNLKYLNNYKLHVLILDSSKNKIKYNLSKIFKNLSIQYVYKKNFNYRDKFLWFVHNVKIDKKYSILIADDDFCLIPVIKQQISLLEKKNNYSCVTGQSLYSHNFFGNTYYRSGYGKPIDLKKKNPIKRLESFFCKKNIPVMYSLCKTNLLLSAIRNMLKFNYGVYALFEIIMSITIIYNSKVLFLDKISWIKNLNDFKTSSPAGAINPINFWSNKKYKYKKKIFLKKVFNILHLKKNNQTFLVKILDRYFKRTKDQNKIFNTKLFKLFLEFIKNYKLYIIKRTLSFFVRFIFRKNVYFRSHDLGLDKAILKELKLIEKHNVTF